MTTPASRFDDRVYVSSSIRGIMAGVGMGIGLSVGLSISLSGGPSLAQSITTDGTTATLVNGGAACSGNCTITGTSIDGSGQTLFHSLGRFNIDTGATVTFVDPGVATILTRVTGNSASAINGTLQVTGLATLFLLNPQGISFGPGARVLVPGSFMATTAEGIVLGNGQVFSATNPAPPPLLTVNVPLGLQFGSTPGPITADQALIVSLTNKTLGLIGGDIALADSVLATGGGQVELGSVGSPGLVNLTANGAGFTASYGNIPTFRDIQLSAGTIVDVSGPDAGSIQVQGRQITLTDRSAFLAIVQPGGTGDGSITLRASDLIRMVGQADDPNNPQPFNTGAQVLIFPGATGTSRVTDSGAVVGTSQVTIETNRLDLSQGAQIGITMVGQGESGTVAVKAQTITVDGGSALFPSAIFTAVDGPGRGKGGTLAITTDQSLRVTNGAQLVASTFALGDAGDFTIQAKDVEVIGTGPRGPSLLASDSFYSPIFGNSGRGGSLTINTDRLTVRDGGQVSTGTRSVTNPAGDLIIRASESVTLQGQIEFGRSGLFASALSTRNPSGTVIPGRGAGGSILVETNRLVLADGATINVSNKPSNLSSRVAAPGLGSAGNITLNARQIQLSNQSVITADTVDGDRGNITFQQADLIVLRQNSQITTNATGTASGGNIQMTTNFLVAVTSENSDITANSVNSFGGRVQITAQGVFGITPRAQLTPFSDITATSALGPEFSGIVEINNPNTHPEQGLLNPSNTLIDPAAMVVAACEQGIGNQFIVTGRGGLPDDATQPLRGYTLWQDLRLGGTPAPVSAPVSASQTRASNPTNLRNSPPPMPPAIQEARQLVKDSQGRVHLAAALPQAESGLPAWSQQPYCQRPK